MFSRVFWSFWALLKYLLFFKICLGVLKQIQETGDEKATLLESF